MSCGGKTTNMEIVKHFSHLFQNQHAASNKVREGSGWTGYPALVLGSKVKCGMQRHVQGGDIPDLTPRPRPTLKPWVHELRED